ncbi:hypothetical protein Tco_1022998 [Tanacetum coccineum]
MVSTHLGFTFLVVEMVESSMELTFSEFGESDGGGGEFGGGDEVGDLGVYSIEEEEVPLVDGVFKGSLEALKALEMEALVDAMECYGG